MAPIILIVPNVVLPPRVPKLLTAIAFKLPIVGYSWVLEKYKSKNSPIEVNLEAHQMEYPPCDNLFSDYVFILPQGRVITQRS